MLTYPQSVFGDMRASGGKPQEDLASGFADTAKGKLDDLFG